MSTTIRPLFPRVFRTQGTINDTVSAPCPRILDRNVYVIADGAGADGGVGMQIHGSLGVGVGR